MIRPAPRTLAWRLYVLGLVQLVLLGAAVENLFNLNFNSLLGRGVEFQGLAPIAAVAAPNGYTYSRGTFNTALVSPGPTTYRITLTKRF